MFELKNIESGGYSVPMGGVSFMIDVNVSENRLHFEGSKARINVVVPFEPKSKMTFTVVSKTIKEDGDVIFWSETNKFTKEERTLMGKWCRKNGVRKEGERILAEYKDELSRYFDLGNQLNEIFNEEMIKNLDYIVDRSERMKKVSIQLDNSKEKLKSLENIQYI
jgi:hypothetical protein